MRRSFATTTTLRGLPVTTGESGADLTTARWRKSKALDSLLIGLPRHERRDPVIRARKQAAIATPGLAASADQLVSTSPKRLRPYLKEILIISRGSDLNAESLAPAPDVRLVNIPGAMVELIRDIVTAMEYASPLVRVAFLRLRAGQPPLVLPHDETIKRWGIFADEIAHELRPTLELQKALTKVRSRLRRDTRSHWGEGGRSFGLASEPPAHVRSSVHLKAAGAVRFVLGHEIAHHVLNHFDGKAASAQWAAPGPELLNDWIEAEAIPRTSDFVARHQRELDADLFGYWLLKLAGGTFQREQDDWFRESHLNQSSSIGLLAFALAGAPGGVDHASKSHPSFVTRLEELFLAAAHSSKVASSILPPIKALGRRADAHPMYEIGVSLTLTRVLGRLVYATTAAD